MATKTENRMTPFKAFSLALVALWLIIAAFPFIWTFWGSFKVQGDFFSKADWTNAVFGVFTTRETGAPFTDAGYYGAWVQEAFWYNFWNTSVVVFFTVAISLTFGTLGGYALARSGFRYAFWILMAALVFRAMPHITLVSGYLLPFFEWNIWGIKPTTIIVLVAINQPFTLWMLHSFFLNIPKDLDESAMVDGCTRFQAFRLVIVPVMWPGVITTGLFSFLLAYNDFAVTSMLLSGENETIIPAIASFLGTTQVEGNVMFAVAAVVMTTAPLFILIMFFQRQIVSGLTAGAVKADGRRNGHAYPKQSTLPLRAAMYDFTEVGVRKALADLISPDAPINMPCPFGDMTGPDALYNTCYAPLLASMPDLERRDWIVMAGKTEHGDDWVGCGGHYMGTFVAPFLDIPPTGHLAHMRFHEFYRLREGKVVEVQTLWDIPELMMQAGAWPMAPSLGLEFHIPGPATLDGLVPGPWEEAEASRSCDTIVEMLSFMKKHPSQGGPEVMEMPRFWHPRMNWYGPAGIGTGRGIEGFRNWHQIPFLNAMPDRGQYIDQITYHFFGDRNYAAVTGWPNMIQTVTHDGWMGVAPGGQKITMCSLDFWRLEDGLIRENWVMVDILDAWRQLGVDVFARLREFNKARPGPR